MCQRRGIEDAKRICQSVPGEALDAAIGQLLLATVTPVALDVALAVQAELEGRAAEADGLRRQHMERARHGAEQARRRYMAVDPDNRLVAVNLEADWNDALRALTQAQEDYERQAAQASPLGEQDRTRVAALASDFPALWSDPRTPQRERKRMARLLIEDVTFNRDGAITAQVRFKGGQTTSLEVNVGLPAPEARRTPAAVIAHIDRLLDDHTEAGVAEQLNQAGIVSGTGQPFHAGIVHHIRVTYQIAPRKQRLVARGLVNIEEAATRLGICTTTVKTWHHEGRITGERINQKGEHYYEIPAAIPRKAVGRPPGTKNRPKQ
jgi:hypothetical protein